MDYLALQTLDGRTVLVNPRAIVSISQTSETRDTSEKLLAGEVHCVVNLTNGKFVTVIERCEAIRARLQKGRTP